MADSLASIALEKLTNVLQQQLTMFAGATHELEKLSSTFQSIQALLNDAESRQVAEESVRVWLSKLKHVAYDIDDVLDEGKIWGLGEEGDDEGDIRNKVCQCLLSPYSCLVHVFSRYKVARRIKEIRERLDQIADDKIKYNFSSSSVGRDHRMLVRSQRLTSSFMEESEKIFGREDDREIMISRLVSGSADEVGGQVHVVAIVGIGGLGKTTLAQQIYHNSKIRDHFNTFLWVCVSDVFDVIRLIKAIFEQVKKESTSLLELDSLQNQLLESLRGKRFLLVLDDVWNDDAAKWKMLSLPLNCGALGSRILVTTRSDKVANTMNATYIHELKGLSDEHSWTLFSSRAFAEREKEECLELENVGRKIVNNCKGVPLSIKVIGSTMHSKRTVEDWENVANSKTWSLSEVTHKILPPLLLTYSNLPTHLKQCFAYCSMFPKDWEFNKDMLVGLWISQGFIVSQGKREIEDVGAENFDNLVEWSMFQEVEEDTYGGTICKMHDLLHDLAEFVAKDEIYTFISSEGGKSEECLSRNVRHAFISFTGTFISFTGTGDTSNNMPITLRGAKKLRTLFLHQVDETDVVADLFQQASFLRSVIFHESVIKTLPNAIGKMKHLRYLDLSGSLIAELPESVSHLHNLQTLNLSRCRELKKLPRGMGGMVSLRHLHIEGTQSLKYLPEGLGRISCLRSLGWFIVGGGEGRGCRIGELKRLNSLHGSLQILNLERVSSRIEAETAQLGNKPHLRRLLLSVSDDAADTERTVNVLEALRPHVNLQVLELSCHSRSLELKMPSWMEDSSFSKLTEITIAGFETYCEPKKLPGLGKLPALKSLEVRYAGVRKLGREFYYGNSTSGCDVISTTAFPKLEKLSLTNLGECEQWDLTTTAEADDAQPKVIMPCLHELKLLGCSKLERLPQHLASAPLKQLSIEGCDRIEGRGCSFPFLEAFKLYESSEFLSSGLLPHLPNLKTFEINRNGIERLPDGGWEWMVALKKLKITVCIRLKSLPDGLTQLQSLEELEISYCRKLESLPEGLGQLKKLNSLEICSVGALTSLPDSLGQLESLEHLKIKYCEKLESVPEWLGQLKRLKSLTIDYLRALRCLPDSLGQLESLQHLTIRRLEKLVSLPRSLGLLKALNFLEIQDCRALKSLPHELKDLSFLQELRIEDCPPLSERCKREGGVDWPKISHIPNITVDRQRIK